MIRAQRYLFFLSALLAVSRPHGSSRNDSDSRSRSNSSRNDNMGGHLALGGMSGKAAVRSRFC